MKQIFEIILIILFSHLKVAHCQSSCQIHVIFLLEVPPPITTQEYRNIHQFADSYKDNLQRNSYIANLTTNLNTFNAYTHGYVFSDLIHRMLELTLNDFLDVNKLNIIVLMCRFVLYEYNLYNGKPLSYYKDVAKSKNTIIQIAAYGDGWYKKIDDNYIPAEIALQLTKAENIFYRQNYTDLKNDIDKMLTNVCNKFQRCGVFPADTIPNVLDSGNCNDIEVQASCTPNCKKLFRPNSPVFCNSAKMFEIKDFKCVLTCIEKPSIDNATEESLRKCAENNKECNIVCADGYEYKAQSPICDESNGQWKLSSSKCETRKCQSKGFKCEPSCIGTPNIDNATEESLRKCAENNKECDIVCDSGYEFNRRPPVCDETKGEWISSESQCKKPNLSLITILLFTVNSLSILSFLVAIIAPELINLCCVRNHVIGETLTSDSDEPDHYADITDPVINIRESK